MTRGPVAIAMFEPPEGSLGRGSGFVVTSTTAAFVAATRAAGVRWILTPRRPPPMATLSSASIDASAMTGHALVDPNGVIVPRS